MFIISGHGRAGACSLELGACRFERAIAGEKEMRRRLGRQGREGAV